MAEHCRERDPVDSVSTVTPGQEWAADIHVGGTAKFGPYCGHVRLLQAGEVLLRQGEPVEDLFRIQRGLVKLMTYLPSGEARIVRLQRAGDWLGLEGFLDEPCNHTAIVLGNVVVERYAMAKLASLRNDDAGRLNRLMRQWHRDLLSADMWIAEFSTGVIRRRVAHLIQYLADLDETEGPHVQLPSVREMGEMLGVRPEGVSRVVADFKRRAILVADGGGRQDTFRVHASRLAAIRNPGAIRPASLPRDAAQDRITTRNSGRAVG